MIENNNLLKIISPSDSELKKILVEYMKPRMKNSETKVTVKNVIENFSKEFPELLLALAEENWINGYTQALQDLEFVEKEKKNVNKRIPKTEEA